MASSLRVDPGAGGAETFCLNLFVRGHHIYKDIWSSVHGEKLHCKRKINNVHDLCAVSVIKDRTGIVGHLPKQISTPCHLILREGGSISCIVNGQCLGWCQYLKYFRIAILKLPKYIEIIFLKMACDFRNIRK